MTVRTEVHNSVLHSAKSTATDLQEANCAPLICLQFALRVTSWLEMLERKAAFVNSKNAKVYTTMTHKGLGEDHNINGLKILKFQTVLLRSRNKRSEDLDISNMYVCMRLLHFPSSAIYVEKKLW